MEWSWVHLGVAGSMLVAFVVGLLIRRRPDAPEVERLRNEVRRLEELAERSRLVAEDLGERLEEANKDARQLEHSLLELPEIAQRLSATRDMRDIPGAALDLIEEIFVPGHAAFYSMSEDGLVCVARRGDSAPRLGHRVQPRESVVGWAAIRQMPITSFEAGRLELDDEAAAAPEFSLCLPVVNGRRTHGVIAVGPCARELPRGREIGRTIALITAVTIAHTQVLREQARLAQTDGLTGLLNRSHLLKQLDKLVARTRRNPRISLFLFDVDHFKHYNDTNGHLAGDELLKQLSALLRQCVRDGELVGRYGGEEFLMVMPGVGGDDALLASDRVRQLIAEKAFAYEEHQPMGDVTVSGGVATWPADGATVAEVLQHADEALYAAKAGGRNEVRAYSRPLPRTSPPTACGSGSQGGAPPSGA